MTPTYRTLWLSDVHLGTLSSRADALLRFIDTVRAERIYLVGDIVDLQRMKAKPCFPDLHLRVVTELARRAASGTEIVFIPGNHDHEFRQIAGQDLLGIPVRLEAVHERANGERLLVIHGDLLDGRIRQGTSLETFGAAAYRLLLEADVLLNRWRRLFGRDGFSISAGIKRRLKGAQEYIRRFEQVAAEYAASRGYDGIVCGHIHRPNLCRIGKFLYANDGDWVEHGSALAELGDGSLQLLRWSGNEVVVEREEPVRRRAA